jgi:hypothetical protein
MGAGFWRQNARDLKMVHPRALMTGRRWLRMLALRVLGRGLR